MRRLRRLRVVARRERRRGRRYQPHFQLNQIGVTSLAALCAVLLLGVLSLWSGQVLIAAPLGASCVLLFGYPATPLAQPRNIVLGNVLGALVGVALVSVAGQGPVVLALAVALTIVLCQQLRCLHPPAGGMAFLAVYLKVGWGFLLFPVLSGSVLLVLLAWGFSRWVPGAQPYPPPLVVTSGLIAAALAVVAFLYACVGHAGASGYIAVLALAGWPAEQIKPLALLLNTLVASVGCWNFLRAGHLPWRRLWPVYVLAIPAAFLGGWLALPALWFRRLVGVVLLLSAWRLGRRLQDPPLLQEPRPAVLMAAGGGLGLLAGLTGTGGGVFLTPLLLLCRWCSTRQAAAVSVLFILVNSIAGLAGLAWAGAWPAGAFPRPDLLLWLTVVVLAGGLGSRLGSRHWPVAWIRRALAAVLLLASWKLLGL